ncbi:putative zinc finger RNA-binding protein [Iris pallida]|uniref:Zinc finger RNA-binding protein n=1 Tax=Iris pallida TaxID=29817 RepID=A0AAX6I4A7_IRIPA|nr:putative zinc finger RNA-binding protein [Iris pallida]
MGLALWLLPSLTCTLENPILLGWHKEALKKTTKVVQ